MAVDYKMKIKATDQTGGAFGKVNKNINTTTSAVKKLAGAFAGAFAVRQIVQFGSQQIALADQLGKTADKLGVNVELLQQLRFAAEQTGVETRTLDMGLQRFIRRVSEAANGTGEAKAALEQLGISFKNADGSARDIKDILFDVADGLAETENSGERVRLAFKLFDSEGVALVNTLQGGSRELKTFFNEAEDLGILLGEESVDQAEEFSDAMNRLRKQVLIPLQGAFITLSNKVLDFLEAKGLVDAIDPTLEEYIDQLQREIEFNKKRLAINEEILAKSKFNNELVKRQVEFFKDLIAQKEAEIATLEIQNTLIPQVTLKRREDNNSIIDQGELIKENIQVVKTFAETIEGKLTNAFTDFFDIASEGFGDFKNLATSIIRAIIAELVQLYIVQQAVGAISSIIDRPGRNFFRDETVGPRKPKIFEDGGYTGNGIRAGGLDGKGGFMAMLHPRETVIDHTKGQTMQQGGGVVNFNISAVDATGFDELLASRKNMIINMVNQAYNSRGKMGIV